MSDFAKGRQPTHLICPPTVWMGAEKQALSCAPRMISDRNGSEAMRFGIHFLIFLLTLVALSAGWLLDSELQRLVLVIVGTDSEETLERWTFNVHKEERPALKDGRYRRALIGQALALDIEVL